MLETGCGVGSYFVPCTSCVYETDPVGCHNIRRESGHRLTRRDMEVTDDE
jgi:hypothetical protein